MPVFVTEEHSAPLAAPGKTLLPPVPAKAIAAQYHSGVCAITLASGIVASCSHEDIAECSLAAASAGASSDVQYKCTQRPASLSCYPWSAAHGKGQVCFASKDRCQRAFESARLLPVVTGLGAGCDVIDLP